ncbi:PH domain-containing protein [Nocardioides sp. SR21]|uniref:PH domain-containing protein n=1 Tax=Nocardioides sp. SR21 TaxID=2919501 RepID=UPI001FAA4D40|nr:PH domain-containing protein [Nocardioides sp. SR21]
MPADSELALPHTWRPFGVRMAGTVLGVGLLVVVAFLWIGFDAETRAKFTTFQRGTVVAIGLLGFAVWFALVRSRVVAEAERLVVVNGYKRREFEYAEVVGVHLPPGAPWVTLDLADGSTVSAMGIQGSDGDRAKQAVRELRGVVNAKS